MQFQADLLGIPVVRPAVIETTALGAAYLAGLSSGVFASIDQLWVALDALDATRQTAEATDDLSSDIRLIYRKAILSYKYDLYSFFLNDTAQARLTGARFVELYPDDTRATQISQALAAMK